MSCPICESNDPNHLCGSILEAGLIREKKEYEQKIGKSAIPVEEMPREWRVRFEMRLAIGKRDLEIRGYD